MRGNIHTGLLILLLVTPVFGEDFVPGDGSIAEKDILSRIEKELGEDLTPGRKITQTQNRPRKAVSPKKKSSGFALRLRLKNKTAISGRVFLSQKEIVLYESSGEQKERHRIRIADLRTLEFDEWKPVSSVSINGKRKKYFLPTRCIALDKTGNRYTGGCRVTEWLQINVFNGNTRTCHRNYFTVSEDGGAKSREQISGNPSDKETKDLEDAQPTDTTVVAIDFENGTKIEQQEPRAAVRSDKVDKSR